MIPPARHDGRPRDVKMREVLNAVFYGLSTGCQWEALPKMLFDVQICAQIDPLIGFQWSWSDSAEPTPKLLMRSST
jgi:transposase